MASARIDFVTSRYVTLELRRPPDVVRWKASVGFVDRTMCYAILGTRGFFEFFDLNTPLEVPSSYIDMNVCVLGLPIIFFDD